MPLEPIRRVRDVRTRPRRRRTTPTGEVARRSAVGEFGVMEGTMAPVRIRQVLFFVLFMVLAGGCAATQGLDTAPPSLILRAAYVTNVVPVSGFTYPRNWQE